MYFRKDSVVNVAAIEGVFMAAGWVPLVILVASVWLGLAAAVTLFVGR